MENNFDDSASVEFVYIVWTFLSSEASISNLANSLAFLEWEPITILDGWRLSFKALPSLKNSGTKIISKLGYFFCIFFIYPTGIVDRIITVGLELDFWIFSNDCSIDEVSNLFVSMS